MANEVDTLPEPVRKALENGRHVEAIRLLREAKGISLKAAKGRIDAIVAKGLPARPPQSAPTGLPPDVTSELARGRKVNAIRLLRALRGVDLKQAKDEIDAAALSGLGPLAPGEQPRSAATGIIALALVALVVAAAFLYFRPL